MNSKAPSAAPSVILASGSPSVVLAGAEARTYTTCLDNNRFVPDWHPDYAGRIDVNELNAAFSEMANMATRLQKKQRSLAIMLFVCIGIAFVLYVTGAVLIALGGILVAMLSCFIAGLCCKLVACIYFLIARFRCIQQFKSEFSALCESLNQRYAARGLYWTYDYYPGSRFIPARLKVFIKVIAVPGLPLSAHPHIMVVMPQPHFGGGGFPPGYQNAPQGYQAVPQGYQAVPQGYQAAPPVYQNVPQGYQQVPQVYQNAPPVYENAPAAYQDAPPVYEQAGSLPEGTTRAYNLDDSAPLLINQ